MNIGHVTGGSALKTLKNERLRLLLCMRSFPEDNLVGQNTFSKKILIPMVILTIKVECATHCNCSTSIHTCLQRDIGSCKCGELRDGKV